MTIFFCNSGQNPGPEIGTATFLYNSSRVFAWNNTTEWRNVTAPQRISKLLAHYSYADGWICGGYIYSWRICEPTYN